MSSGFYLLDHPNPHGKKYYPTRNTAAKYIVIHTAENLPDVAPPDLGAEAIARYLASTNRDASCHECVDTDSFVPMLPDNYTAWHAKGANSNGWGLEICTQAAKWGDLPPEYRQRLYEAAATRARRAALALNIPLVKTTFGGPAGFIGHAEVDPSRRSDPGRSFDWDYFMSIVNVGSAPVQPTLVVPAAPAAPIGAVASAPPPPSRPLKATTRSSNARLWQSKMRSRGWRIDVDGIYGPASAAICRKFQEEKRLVVDGMVGPQTWAATWKAPVT